MPYPSLCLQVGLEEGQGGTLAEEEEEERVWRERSCSSQLEEGQRTQAEEEAQRLSLAPPPLCQSSKLQALVSSPSLASRNTKN